ncbi:MAG: DUF4296 domain-containing protein [Amoebophilaceae bacterium]|nr:DUF4296 domain-containing protein [Amoebophilaceae bacterium]
MKKKLTVTLFLCIGFFSGKFKQKITNWYLSPIVEEVVFVAIATDLELLDSWLTTQHIPSTSANRLRYQIYQEILALHNIEQKRFEESLTYYLASSLEQAIKIYTAIYASLETLSLPLPST